MMVSGWKRDTGEGQNKDIFEIQVEDSLYSTFITQTLQSTYHVSDSVLGSRDTPEKKADENLMEIRYLVRDKKRIYGMSQDEKYRGDKERKEEDLRVPVEKVQASPRRWCSNSSL